MDQTVLLWILGIVVTVVLGLVIGFVAHVKEDTSVRERVATLEERSSTHGDEIKSIRNMRHEIIEHCTEALAQWYQRVIEMIAKLK